MQPWSSLLILPQRSCLQRNYTCSYHVQGSPDQLLVYASSKPTVIQDKETHGSYFFYFLFCIGVQPINNVVIVSSGQHGDSVIFIHVSILPQTALPSRLPHNIEHNSRCYTVGTCWLLCVLNVAVCTCPPQSPQLSLPHLLTLAADGPNFFLQVCESVSVLQISHFV